MGTGHLVEYKSPNVVAVFQSLVISRLLVLPLHPQGSGSELELLSKLPHTFRCQAPSCRVGAQDRPSNPVSKIKLLYRVRVKTATITWPTHAGLNAGRWCKGWCWGQREDRVSHGPCRALRRVLHRAKMVKKMCILIRKVVTEPWRQSFISTSRAKSRGSCTDRCR